MTRKYTVGTRIYLVAQGQTVRLVRAGHRAQAINHVARELIKAKVASQDELIEAVKRGIVVETPAEDTDTKELEFDREEVAAAGA